MTTKIKSLSVKRATSLLLTLFEKRLLQLNFHLNLFPYQKWLRTHEELSIARAVNILGHNEEKTMIFILRPINDQPLKFTIESLQQQSLSNWICVLPRSAPYELDSRFIRADYDHTTFLSEDAINSLIKQIVLNVPSDYIIMLSTGDRLHPHYCTLLQGISSDIIYTDQDLISANGSRHSPFLKPEWSPTLWTNVDILYGAAFSTNMLRKILEQRHSCDPIAECVFLASRISHLPYILLHTQVFPWENALIREEHKKRVIRYLSLKGLTGISIVSRSNGSLKPKWVYPMNRVSIIIPTRDRASILRRCIESLKNLTDYPDYEIIIVDNQSSENETHKLYRTLVHKYRDLRIISTPLPFNFSQACNEGSRHASGAYLLFLNNDVEITDPNWLRELVQLISIPDIGAVGAKLVHPDGTLQHVGIVIGMEGHAHHVFMGLNDNNEDKFTPYGFINWQREVSAVTGACLMVKRTMFEEIGGFDESYTLVLSDVDLCLRLNDCGYRVIVNPDSRLTHYEGQTRGKHLPQQDLKNSIPYFSSKIALGDPFYNPGLSRAWHIPALRPMWEQNDLERFKNILFMNGLSWEFQAKIFPCPPLKK